MQSVHVYRTFSTKGIARQCVHNSALLSSWSTPIGRGLRATGLMEYQKPFRAHYLTQNLRHAKGLYLYSANQVAFMHSSPTAHTDPSPRRLRFNLREVSEAVVQRISQLEAAGQLDYVDVRVHRVTPALKLLCNLSSLRSLDLRRTTITNEDLRCLQGCRNLVKLNLSHCRRVTDLSPISHIQTLEIMKLTGCRRLVSVGALGKLPRLNELDVSNTLITDEDVRQLGESRALVKIDLRSCKALTNVNPLCSIATLEVIYLSRCTSLTHVGALGKLPVLKAVYLSETPITDEEVRLLSECQSLVKIELGSCKALTNVNPLSSIATLEEINLEGCTSLTHAGELGRSPVLKEVYLSETPITDEEVCLLSECQSLVKIELGSCKALTNVNPLCSIATLEVIYLSRCTSLTHVGALGKLPVLKAVYLSETPITDEDVRLLSECQSLVKIELGSCKALTNVNPLSSIATLEEINLEGCTSLTHVGALGKLPVLKAVNLSETPITDEDVRLLSECQSLVKIELGSCKALTNVNPLSSIATLEEINLEGCTSLTHVGALGKLPVLKAVYLSDTPITDEEVRLLSECQSLVKIELGSCKALTNVNPLSSIATLEEINLEGCTSLTHAGELGRSPVLKEVYLSETPITDEEVCLLSECQSLVKIELGSCKALTNVNPLCSIATLEVIYLSRCTSLTHVGALGKLPVLKAVYLSETPITDEEVRLLSECQSLVKIELGSCKALTNVNPLSSIATLEEINLEGCTSLTHVGALGKLPVLKAVYLSETPITDEEVRLLSECQSLVKIDLRSCKALTNVDPLCSIATLEVIYLSRCTSLTHAGELGKLPVLKEVYLSGTPITDEEVCLLSECQSLVKIELGSCKALTNVNPLCSIATLEVIYLEGCTSLTHVGALGKLPVLKAVYLSDTPITDEEVRLLSECQSLVKIELGSCKALTNVNPLCSIATLEVIYLSRCTSLTHVGALGKLPVLKAVYLSETPITDEEVRLLSECQSLVKIELGSCKALTNVNPLSSIATLEEINLEGCTSLTHAGELGRSPVLKEVYLSETPITDEEVRLLSECQSLVKIDLRSCKALTNVDPLCSIATLEVIYLSRCTSLTHAGELGKLPVLKEVYLSGTPITDEEVCLLSECQSLVKIELGSCKALTNVNPLSSIATLEEINLEGCTSLTHAGELGRSPVLKEVYLSGTPITDEEVRLLSECQSLVKIDLRSCKALTNVNPLSSIATLEEINLEGCTSLTHVGALGKLPVLKAVYLSETPITDEDVRLLSECQSLVKIELGSCKALTNVNPLSSIATLEEINLEGCTSLTHVGALGKLPVLKAVNLSETPITDEEVRLLSKCQLLVKIELGSCKALTNVNPLSSIATLEEINLKGCTSITHVGALGKLPVLKEVALTNTRITDEEVRQLSECHTLVKIELGSCKALTNVDPLCSIATLEEINLFGCSSLKCVAALFKAPKLMSLCLVGTRFKYREVDSLNSLRKHFGLPSIDYRCDIF